MSKGSRAGGQESLGDFELPETIEAGCDWLLGVLLDPHGRSEQMQRLVDALREADGVWSRRLRRHPDDLTAVRVTGQLEPLLAIATAAVDRMPSERTVKLLSPGSRAHQVLSLVCAETSIVNNEIAQRLGIDKAQVSRLLSRLARERAIVKVKRGRQVFSDITPIGEDALREADALFRERTRAGRG